MAFMPGSYRGIRVRLRIFDSGMIKVAVRIPAAQKQTLKEEAAEKGWLRTRRTKRFSR